MLVVVYEVLLGLEAFDVGVEQFGHDVLLNFVDFVCLHAFELSGARPTSD